MNFSITMFLIEFHGWIPFIACEKDSINCTNPTLFVHNKFFNFPKQQ
ncbi:hypothetical protein P9112_013038 [Eukaryota sp. TZLM1-RC]